MLLIHKLLGVAILNLIIPMLGLGRAHRLSRSIDIGPLKPFHIRDNWRNGGCWWQDTNIIALAGEVVSFAIHPLYCPGPATHGYGSGDAVAQITILLTVRTIEPGIAVRVGNHFRELVRGNLCLSLLLGLGRVQRA